jgi:hypothetical protein
MRPSDGVELKEHIEIVRILAPIVRSGCLVENSSRELSSLAT